MYLRYYAGDRFPLDQNTGGPYTAYPGTPQMARRFWSRASTQAGLSYSSDPALARIHQPRPCRCTTRRRAIGGLRGLGDQAYLPAGSQLAYNVTWASGLHFTAASGIAAQIKPALSSQWGIEIDSEADNPSSFMNQPQGFSLRVHTTRDYGAANDVKSIIDGALINSGRQPSSSSISVFSSPQVDAATQTAIESVAQQISERQAAGDTAAVALLTQQLAVLRGAGAAPPADFGTFLSNNWPWLVAGGAAAIILPRVL